MNNELLLFNANNKPKDHKFLKQQSISLEKNVFSVIVKLDILFQK